MNVKRVLSVILSICMVRSMLPVGVLAAKCLYENGFCVDCDAYEPAVLNGKVYEISNAGQLYWYAAKVNEEKLSFDGKLMKNIVVNENVLNTDGTLNGDGSNFRVWTPIADWNYYSDIAQYLGTFDGNGKTVSGLYYSGNDCYVGLFHSISSRGVIKNVGITDSFLRGSEYVGGVVGRNDGTVSNCYNTGSVRGIYAGGVVGINYGTVDKESNTVDNCYNTGAVSGSLYVGGVVGYNSAGTINNCYNSGTVSGSEYIGGVVGYVEGGTVTNCHNTAVISGDREYGSYYVGGVAGINRGLVEYCYNVASVSGVYDVGGVVGDNRDRVHYCYNTGSVSALDRAGGITSENYSSVRYCNNTGSISGRNNISGVVGVNYSYVEYCYNSGNVNGSGGRVGGVAGTQVGAVTNCYNSGSVSGSGITGGVVGYNGGYDWGYTWGYTVDNCYNTGSVSRDGRYYYDVVGYVVGKNENGSVRNCYYLEDLDTRVLYGTPKTLEQFASGEVAYLLQGDKSKKVWGQTIGTDECPVLGGEKVYKNQISGCNADSYKYEYSNS